MVLFLWSSPGGYTARAQEGPLQPNIVFILTDDMRYDDLKYMPKTRLLLAGQGMSFSKAFVSNALCCPARATIMRGQYSHNNGVWTNDTVEGPDAGWQAYQTKGNEQDNVATRLDDSAGYRTGLFGKYLNGYDGTSVPMGWDVWFGGVLMNGDEYYDYDMNDNGTIVHFGTTDNDYLTDVLRRRVKTFIGTSVAKGKPFFAYVAPTAPHAPSIPAPRDQHTYDGIQASRSPSFNEANVSDKHPWIQQLPILTTAQIAAIDSSHEKRAETLQAVDDLVEGVVNKLNSTGAMDNTYIFFTSDNGLHEGEHRIPRKKGRPYEEDIRMPLLVRGPNVAAGYRVHKLVLNTDYLPTFTDLACSSPPTPCDTHNWGYVPDGRSLRPVLEGNATAWRTAILLESHQTPEGGNAPAAYGIRTNSKKYVEYDDGTRELYDPRADPYELTNSYDPAAPPLVLVARLQALKGCAGNGCFAAENGP